MSLTPVLKLFGGRIFKCLNRNSLSYLFQSFQLVLTAWCTVYQQVCSHPSLLSERSDKLHPSTSAHPKEQQAAEPWSRRGHVRSLPAVSGVLWASKIPWVLRHGWWERVELWLRCRARRAQPPPGIRGCIGAARSLQIMGFSKRCLKFVYIKTIL